MMVDRYQWAQSRLVYDSVLIDLLKFFAFSFRYGAFVQVMMGGLDISSPSSRNGGGNP